jgi:ubiquinone/menaquinone biosynthesis C-methylase UbiE
VREETRDHYDRLAPVYDQNWAYSQDFLEWMSGCILARLRVNYGDRVVDVGCGTGLYARRLADQRGAWCVLIRRRACWNRFHTIRG